MPTRAPLLTLALLACLAPLPIRAQTPPRSADTQIAGAIAPAPAEYRDAARVLGYDATGELVTLREGSGLICLADDPGDERFHTACYHESLEPFMARGRELRTRGLSSSEVDQVREMQIQGGQLAMPEVSALYSITAPIDAFDPATGELGEGNHVYVVYLPFATGESTGLPEKPPGPDAPWLMGAGTATAHVMYVLSMEPSEPMDHSEH